MSEASSISKSHSKIHILRAIQVLDGIFSICHQRKKEPCKARAPYNHPLPMITDKILDLLRQFREFPVKLSIHAIAGGQKAEFAQYFLSLCFQPEKCFPGLVRRRFTVCLIKPFSQPFPFNDEFCIGNVLKKAAVMGHSNQCSLV